MAMFEVFMYKNKYPLPNITNDDFMAEVKNMECREDDIFIITYPRSGTNWMREIVLLLLVDGHLEQVPSNQRLLAMELGDVKSHSQDVAAKIGPTLRKLKDAPSPRVFITHLRRDYLPRQLDEKGCKVIYVLRNPKDVISSFYTFLRKIHNGKDTQCEDTPELFDKYFNLFITGQYRYGSWFEHVLEYDEYSSNDRCFFTTYESMKSNIRQVITEVASFIGRKPSEETLERIVNGVSIESMRLSFKLTQTKLDEVKEDGIDKNVFIDKGSIGQWRDRFTPEQNERFNEMFRSKMHNCELTKTYSLE